MILLDKLKKSCPSCGSGDVSWCPISYRAYCNDCKFWDAVNHGTVMDGIKSWNKKVEDSEK